MLSADLIQFDTDTAESDVKLRRALIERIAASPHFAKSPRLSEFLKHVCQPAEEGKFDQIKEQNIGAVVFGRGPGYDPAVDTIVRSHASHLRHRLRQYFEQEGSEEILVVTMPRGSYIPLFTPHIEGKTPQPSDPVTSSPIEFSESSEEAPEPDSTVASRVPSTSFGDQEEEGPLDLVAGAILKIKAQQRTILLLRVALVLTVLLAVSSAILLTMQSRRNAYWRNHPLWGPIFSSNSPSIIVAADSGLVMLQNITKNRVSLASYLNGEYLNDTDSLEAPKTLVRDLALRRYTSTVDLGVHERILRMLGNQSDRVILRYARDLRLDELKRGNAILIGTSEATPWVQLFEPSMNFYFENDLRAGVFPVMNRHPKPGEQPHYDYSGSDPTRTVYGVVALRPNLSDTGDVLILEGQTMAGTQTASDFVFDDSYLLPFLKKIRNPDGSTPFFEILLRSRSLGGESSRSETIAYRVEEN